MRRTPATRCRSQRGPASRFHIIIGPNKKRGSLAGETSKCFNNVYFPISFFYNSTEIITSKWFCWHRFTFFFPFSRLRKILFSFYKRFYLTPNPPVLSVTFIFTYLTFSLLTTSLSPLRLSFNLRSNNHTIFAPS